MSGNEGDQRRVRLRCQSQVRDLQQSGGEKRDTASVEGREEEEEEKKTTTVTKVQVVNRKIVDYAKNKKKIYKFPATVAKRGTFPSPSVEQTAVQEDFSQ